MTRKELTKRIKQALNPPKSIKDPNRIQETIARELASAIVAYVKNPEG